MYGKKFRLPIKEAQNRAKKVFSSPYFLVKAAKNKEGFNRFAVIISVAAVKKSSKRHFWKRRFAEFLRKLPDIGGDFLFIVFPAINKISAGDLAKDLNDFWESFTEKGAGPHA